MAGGGGCCTNGPTAYFHIIFHITKLQFSMVKQILSKSANLQNRRIKTSLSNFCWKGTSVPKLLGIPIPCILMHSNVRHYAL